MIVIRKKDAKPLSSALSSSSDPYFFSNKILASKKIDFIYFDGVIKFAQYTNKFGHAFILLGMLERNNLPFIMMLNRKCDVFYDKETIPTVVNADGIRYDKLYTIFDSERKEESKAKLLHTLFKNCIQFKGEGLTDASFYHFIHAGANVDVVTKDLLFIAMSPRTGNTYNANPHIGKFYNDKRVWLFNEVYDYDPKEVDMTPRDKVEEFIERFHQNRLVNASSFDELNEAEITEVIKLYPMIFADVVLTNAAWYDKADNEKIKNNPDDYSLFKYLGDDVKEKSSEEELNEFLDVACGIDDIPEMDDIPLSMTFCAYCDNVFPKNQTELVHFDEKDRDVCMDCLKEMFKPGDPDVAPWSNKSRQDVVY